MSAKSSVVLLMMKIIHALLSRVNSQLGLLITMKIMTLAAQVSLMSVMFVILMNLMIHTTLVQNLMAAHMIAQVIALELLRI